MKIIGIVGWKNTGKTFFVSEIIKKLKSQNYRIASIKHAHHEFDIDHPILIAIFIENQGHHK